MKFSLFAFIFLNYVSFSNAQNVNIPDANFKAALLAIGSINTNGDTEIQLSEAQSAQFVSVVNQGINDLTGIEEFTNITALFFGNNNVMTADLRNLTKLSSLICNNNQLTSLLIPTNNIALRNVNASYNQLSSLNLTNALDSIVTLDLSHNQLTNIDLSSLDLDATIVLLDNNQLTNIVFPSISSMIKFTCNNNRLVNLTMPIRARYLDCGNNPMDSLWVTGAIGTGQRIDCDSNQLRYLKITSDYDSLVCHHNLLTEQGILDNSSFEYVDLSYNNIDSIRIVYAGLRYLDVSHNQLNRLSILANSATNIFPLDASNNPNLECIRTDNTTYVSNGLANWTIDNQTSISDDCDGVWSSINNLITLKNIRLYPNPTISNIQLDLGQLHEDLTITVYNNLGQEIYTAHQIHKATVELSLPHFQGIYFVKIQTKKGQAILKVLKEEM